MIGSALKKFAVENGMTVSNGYAYGSFRGYDAVFCEGAGTKTVIVYSYQPDESCKNALREKLDGMDAGKKYRLKDLIFSEGYTVFIFLDKMGTMKLIKEFLDILIPVMKDLGFAGSDVCHMCGMPLMNSDGWKIFNGVPRRAHSHCMELALSKLEQAEDTRWEEQSTDPNTGFGKGFIGAVLGAVVGAVIWAVIFMRGYVTALGGLLIVFCARKGYDLFRGKKGKPAVFILALVTLLGVALGTLLGYTGEIAMLIMQGEFRGLELRDTFSMLQFLFTQPDFVSEFTKNLVLGMFYAVIGCVFIFRDLWKSNTKQKFGISELK